MMYPTSQFLLWLPKPDNQSDPTAETRFLETARRAQLSVVPWGAARLAVAGTYPDEAGHAVLDVYPHRIPHLPAQPAGVDAAWAERHAQIFNLLQWDGHTITIQSDAMGLKPAYWAETPHGWIFASTIADILQCEPNLAQPIDPIAVQFLFIGRSIWEDRTLHQKVRRLATGGVYTWTAQDGVTVTRARRWRLPPPDQRMTWDTFCTTMDSEIERLMDETLAGDPKPMALSLSGGYDSRLLASLLVDKGHRPTAITFGADYTREVRAATEIARALKLPHRTVPYRDDLILGQLDQLTRWFEGCCDLSLGQATAVQDLALPPVRLVQGFAGDLIAGSFAARVREGDDASLDSIAASIVRFYAPTRPNLGRLLDIDFDEDALADSVRADLGDDSEPLPALWRWAWENHVRRYTAGLLHATHPWADLLLPYYDFDYVAFWSRVPLEGLRGRTWFKQWFASRFPQLGRIPHPEMYDLIAQQHPARAMEWVRQKASDAAKRVIGERRAEEFMRSIGRSSYIYDGPNLTSRRHQQQLFKRVDQMRPTLQRRLGFRLENDFAAALPDKNGRVTQSARLLLTLCAYAGRLDKTLARPITIRPAAEIEDAVPAGLADIPAPIAQAALDRSMGEQSHVHRPGA